VSIAFEGSNSYYGASVTYTIKGTGNLLVFAIKSTEAISAVQDTKGHTWNLAKGYTDLLTDLWIYWTISNGTGSTTFSFTGSGDQGCAIHEYSGIATSPVDQTGQGSSSVYYVSTGNMTTTQADELIFAIAGMTGSEETWSSGSGFTERQEESSCSLATEDKIVSSIDTYIGDMTGSKTGYVNVIISVTFKAVGGGPPITDAPETLRVLTGARWR
jgi:hypothetical protein